MSNTPNNRLGNLVTICPFCNAHIVNQYPIIDLNIYTKIKDNGDIWITFRKTYTKGIENHLFVKSLIMTSLKKKPFLARVILSKPYRDITNELKIMGVLTNDDIKHLKQHEEYKKKHNIQY